MPNAILAWGARVSTAFALRVHRMAADLGCDPNWIMACIAFETGRTFDPAVRNPVSGATGLIQFMPRTAISLGTTVEALAAMTAEEQLEYVAKYFEPFKGRLISLPDCYMAILWPAAVGKHDSTVLFSAPSIAYEQNKGLDRDPKDGTVTKLEAAQPVWKALTEGMRDGNRLGPIDDEVDDEVADESPLAPIEDLSVPARPEDIERIHDQESPRPMAPLAFILPLLQSLFTVFTPLARTKLEQVLNKQTDDPAMSQQMAAQILEIIKQTAAGAGGAPIPPAKTEADEVLAAAKAVAIVKENAELRAQAETAVLDYLEKLSPLIDKIHLLEQAGWTAEELSRDAGARRAATDTIDLGKPIAIYVLSGFAIVVLGLLGALALHMYKNPGAPDPTLVSLLAGAVGVIISKLNTIVDYRFGSSRGSAAKDVIMNAMHRENASQGQPIVSATPNARVTATVTK